MPGVRKSDLFEALQGFLPGGQGSVSRAELAAKRGVSVGAIDVAVHRLRQRFGALLREQVAQTVSIGGRGGGRNPLPHRRCSAGDQSFW